MQLTLDRLIYPWLQPSYFKMHLLDNRCYPYLVNETHIIVKTSFRECKTMKKNSSHRITYRNVLMAFVRGPPWRVITRVPDVFFPFQCRFDHEKMASISTELNEVAGSYPSGNSVVWKSRMIFMVDLVMKSFLLMIALNILRPQISQSEATRNQL